MPGGSVLHCDFRNSIAIEYKTDGSPVSITDREVEVAHRDIARREAPGRGIIGQKLESEQPDADGTWMFDPIAGTQSIRKILASAPGKDDLQP
jgi:fructose-1,6-bisphosphatase/inositol monophosphatase family enzyme